MGGEKIYRVTREWLGVRKCSPRTLFLLPTSQLASSHPLGKDPGFPLQHGWHCPTLERGARSLECLATIEDREGGRGQEGNQPFPSALRKGKLRRRKPVRKTDLDWSWAQVSHLSDQ